MCVPRRTIVQGELWRRSRLLIAHLVGEVLDVDEVRLVDLVASARALEDEEGVAVWSEKTISNVVRDLADFGAFRILNRQRGDRAVRLTILGRAWLAGVILPGIPGLSLLEAAVEELFEDLEPFHLDGSDDLGS